MEVQIESMLLGALLIMIIILCEDVITAACATFNSKVQSQQFLISDSYREQLQDLHVGPLDTCLHLQSTLVRIKTDLNRHNKADLPGRAQHVCTAVEHNIWINKTRVNPLHAIPPSFAAAWASVSGLQTALPPSLCLSS